MTKQVIKNPGNTSGSTNFMNIDTDELKNVLATMPEEPKEVDNKLYGPTPLKLDLSPDAPLETNEKGAKQSHLGVDFTLIDGPAMFALAKTLHNGAKKYEKDNWRGLAINDHLNHTLSHIYAYLSGDNQDDHLEHAFCRMMMALAKYLEPVE